MMKLPIEDRFVRMADEEDLDRRWPFDTPIVIRELRELSFWDKVRLTLIIWRAS